MAAGLVFGSGYLDAWVGSDITLSPIAYLVDGLGTLWFEKSEVD